MNAITLPMRLRASLWILAIHEVAWLVLDLPLTVTYRTPIWVVESVFRAALSFLIVGALRSSSLSIQILSWALRIWGILSVIGTVGVIVSQETTAPTWLRLEMASFAGLYVVVGFSLAKSYKTWKQAPKRALADSTIPPLDVQEPYVRYPRS